MRLSATIPTRGNPVQPNVSPQWPERQARPYALLVFMAMMDVWAVRVLVDARVVTVRVAVLTADRRLVMVVVVPVVMSMGVLVVQWLVGVAVRV